MEKSGISPNSLDPDHTRIVEEAAVWFATLHGGAPSKEDRKALQAWLAADPRHAEAYANMDRLWAGSIDLPGLKQRHLAVRKAISRRRFGKAVVVAAVGTAAWQYLATYPFADYRTAKGERRTITLTDGSTVDLAAETRLSVAFTPQKRDLVLHEGEAFFSVAPAIGRPFTVEAGAGHVTALGTAFGIDYRDDSTTVVVTENAVDVTLKRQSAHIAAGSMVTYYGSSIGKPQEAELATEFAWREGRLIFTQAPLGRVVQALNPWRSGRLVVMSGALAARPITLIVDLDRTDAIVSQLAKTVPMRIVNVTPYVTLLFAAG